MTYKGRRGMQRAALTDSGRMRITCSRWHLEFKDHLDRKQRIGAFCDKNVSMELAINIGKLIDSHGEPGKLLKHYFTRMPSRIVDVLRGCGLIANGELTTYMNWDNETTPPLSILEVHGLARIPGLAWGPGIYFLCRRNVVYVGQANCMAGRVSEHVRRSNMRFDPGRTFFLPCPEATKEELRKLEKKYIKKLQPEYNKVGKDSIQPSPTHKKYMDVRKRKNKIKRSTSMMDER